jgi:alpha-mannosidase
MDSSATPELLAQLNRLRSLSRIEIANWRWQAKDLPTALTEDFQDWSLAERDEKKYWSWQPGEVYWFATTIQVPTDLASYPTSGQSLRLSLVWWSIDAQIYVNGQLVQAGDLFDFRARVLLGTSVQAGDFWDVRIRLVSPGHDRGALIESIALYESNDPQQPEPGFIADEIAISTHYGLAGAVVLLQDLRWLPQVTLAAFQQQLLEIRQELQAQFQPGDARIYLLGHAHLDLAWLWPVDETWEVAERTFESVLALQAEYPQLTFCHTSPVLYDWIERHRPQLFDRIQIMARSGRWEVVGGMWVEPDLNLISGESIARQLIYGQRYTREKFGQVSKVAWLPDTFGFCQQLPQLMKLGQMAYFVTQKFRWNDTNAFPHQLFWWQSPDGSQVLSYMSAPIGEGLDPVKVAAYGNQWQQDTGDTQALWLLGVGDHGGGPTKDMLEVRERWQTSSLCPPLEFTTVQDYLAARARADLPVWQDELYLEFHRGCFTTHAEQKRANRSAERDLYQAELWSAIANALPFAKRLREDLLGDREQPPHFRESQSEVEKAWKLLLFQQFHDILPGSAISEVYVRANWEWAMVKEITDRLQEKALEAICSQISLPSAPDRSAVPLVVFNSLNWSRSTVLHWPCIDRSWQVTNHQGQPLDSIWSNGDLQIAVPEVPSVGYCLLWLIPDATKTTTDQATTSDLEKSWVLENDRLRATISSQTGDIISLWDPQRQLEILATPANQLQAFTDANQYWDAWNIDPAYAEHPLPAAELRSIQWLPSSPLAQRLQVIRQIGKSQFTQVYVLHRNSPQLDIETTVDWQERHVLVKAVFPLAWSTNTVAGEVACGVMERPTNPQDPLEKAKWEVPVHRWLDSTSPDLDYGLAILNNSKYGYSYRPDRLEITLLRAPTWPDPEADRGCHQFTYALYPHSGSWQTAQLVRRGYELNYPLQASLILASNPTAALPPIGSFLELGAENLVLMALQPSMDYPDKLVLRCYETAGQKAQCKVSGLLDLDVDLPVDLLESPMNDREEQQMVGPWQIKSWWLKST